MLSYNEITTRKYIVLDNEPYEVLTSNTAKKNRQKPVNQTKLKNLISGKVTERAFHQSDNVTEADITTQKIQYLYNNKGEFWFAEENNPKNRFTISAERISDGQAYLKEKELVDALIFNDEIINITLPIKMDFVVSEAPPSIRGNTAQGGDKVVTLETGGTVTTPLFIGEGDTIRVNTETGEYVERVTKA